MLSLSCLLARSCSRLHTKENNHQPRVTPEARSVLQTYAHTPMILFLPRCPVSKSLNKERISLFLFHFLKHTRTHTRLVARVTSVCVCELVHRRRRRRCFRVAFNAIQSDVCLRIFITFGETETTEVVSPLKLGETCLPLIHFLWRRT